MVGLYIKALVTENEKLSPPALPSLAGPLLQLRLTGVHPLHQGAERVQGKASFQGRACFGKEEVEGDSGLSTAGLRQVWLRFLPQNTLGLRAVAFRTLSRVSVAVRLIVEVPSWRAKYRGERELLAGFRFLMTVSRRG